MIAVLSWACKDLKWGLIVGGHDIYTQSHVPQLTQVPDQLQRTVIKPCLARLAFFPQVEGLT